MKKHKILFSILIVLLFVSACATNTNDDINNDTGDENQAVTPNEEIPEEETPEDDTADKVDEKHLKNDFSVNLDHFDIFDKFLTDYDGVQVTKLELSFKDLGYVYEIEGMTSDEEIEVEYDANTGELIELERDSFDSDKNFLVREDLNQINDFFKIVFDDAGEAYHLKEWTLKDKNGEKIIEFEVVNNENNEIEYKYDYDTKELIEKD